MSKQHITDEIVTQAEKAWRNNGSRHGTARLRAALEAIAPMLVEAGRREGRSEIMRNGFRAFDDIPAHDRICDWTDIVNARGEIMRQLCAHDTKTEGDGE
jgi:hypothetical protein